MMSTILKSLKIIGCRGKVDSVEAFLQKAREFVSNYDSEGDILLQFLNADMVIGKEHILSAVEHAYKAFERDDNVCSTKGMEILIYAAGEPQINSALAKIGLKDGCERIAVIIGGQIDVEGLLTILSLERDDTVLDYDPSKLRKFGISEAEISAVEKDKLGDLVLERIAMVDVKK